METVVRREIVYDPFPSQQKFHDVEARFKGFVTLLDRARSAALCARGNSARVYQCWQPWIDWRADIPDASGCHTASDF